MNRYDGQGVMYEDHKDLDCPICGEPMVPGEWIEWDRMYYCTDCEEWVLVTGADGRWEMDWN